MIANPLFFGSGINSLICCRSAFKCSFKLPFCGAPPFRWIVNLFDVSFNNAGNLPGSYKIEIAFPLCSCQLMKRMKQNYESKMKKKSESDRNKRGFIPKCVIFILYDAILFSYIDWRQFESMMTRKRRNIPIHVEWSESVFWNRNWWVFYLLVEWDLFLAILYVALSESLQIWLYNYQDFFSIFTFEHHANFGQYSAKNSKNIWEILQNIIIEKYI